MPGSVSSPSSRARQRKVPTVADELDLSELSFADDLFSAGDSQISWLKMLIYGPSGAGKTTLLATMKEPLLVLLTEKQGEMTIKRVNPRAKIRFIEDTIVCVCHGKKPERCPTGGKKTEKLTAKQVLYGMIEELATKKHPFMSVALDSLTDLQQIFLSDMKGGQPGKKVSLPEWGVLIDYTKDVIIRLRNLNMHVGVICLSDEIQDNNQRLIYRPQLAGKKLPSSILQYFNLVAFQRKQRDRDAVGGATYESVFDAGDEYYTKTHPALAPIEVPLYRNWVDKVAEYAKSHGEGDMPSASAPVSSVVNTQRKNDVIKERINQPKIKELFDKLEAPEAKRIATAEKYRSDDKLLEILNKRVEEANAVKAKAETQKQDDAKGETKTEPPAALAAGSTNVNKPAADKEQPKVEAPVS